MRGRVRRGLLGAAVVVVAATAGAPALAQSSGQGASQAADVASVSQLYNQGVDAAKKNDWPKAYESFLAAWKIKEHYQIAANLGRAEIKMGKHRDAVEHLAYFLREAQGVSADDRKKAQDLLTEAKHHVGTLIIKVNRPGAEVLVDGQAVGVAPLSREIYLDPGTHTLEARMGAENTEKVPVELSGGQSRQVGLWFGRAPVAEEQERKPAVNNAQPVTEESSTGTRKALIGVGIGLSVVALGIGGVATGLSFAEASDRDEACNPPGQPAKEDCTREDWDKFETSRTRMADVAIGGFVTGGLLLGATVAYAIVGAPSEPSVKIMLRTSPQASGVMMAGTW